jgi:ABC-type nickel/cobalt efflux system permease component RcnA
LQIICKTIAIVFGVVYHGVTMKFLGKKYRKRWIAGLLLVAYGTVGVLGYGLHAIWDCGHHCHEHAHAVGIVHAHHDDHSHGCHHHHDRGPVIVAGEADALGLLTAVDDCPICEFLVQAQSPFVLEIGAASVAPVSTIFRLLEHSHVALVERTHPARGPPLG